jgi:hypothetical protein
MPWYAGNIHCHSTNSDGDTPPDEVAKWYYENGYSFLSITDHNSLTLEEEYKISDENFIVIQGSEYTVASKGGQTHVNGINIDEPLAKPDGSLDLVASLQYGIDEIQKLGGLTMINHPNWLWSFNSKEMLQLKNMQLFEVYNAGYTGNNEGDETHSSTDQIWDELLSAKINIFGVASDDAHHFYSTQNTPNGFKDSPGGGWLWVQAEVLSKESIMDAIRKGDFIATTGVKLSSLIRNNDEISFEIEKRGMITFKTTFIGKDGKILSVQNGESASYKFNGDEGYVRARIESSDRIQAWVQPVFL